MHPPEFFRSAKKLIRNYSEFVKPFINEFVDPRLKDANQNIKGTNDTVKDIEEGLLKYADNIEGLTTSMTKLLN